jgi:transcriptional regulator with XRE-family HTH domain
MKPEPIYKTIGTIIRRRRRRLEWPQKLLAARLGISRATLANIETGRQRILVHHLYAFAEVLQMKPNDFLPAGASADAAQDWSLLPIPDDLNLRQKEQIARMIGPVRKTTPKLKGGNHGPSKKTH